MSWGQAKAPPTVDPKRARIDARTVLLQSVHSRDPLVRTHAYEAIGKTMGARQGRILMQGLNDSFVSVQYAAAMALGDAAYRPARAKLVHIVQNPESDQRVVCAAIYALHRLGDDTYTGQLATLLRSDVDKGRATAATAMGKIGEASAIGPLQSLLGDEQTPAVRVSVVEALARLGDQRSMRMLESYAKQYFLDLRLAAIPLIGQLRVPGAQRILLQLLKNHKSPPRVRVAAAGALGALGDPLDDEGEVEDNYALCRSALETPDTVLRDFFGENHAIRDTERSSLQQLAALSLGIMGQPKAVNVLHPFLREADGAVQVAAAMAILELLAPEADTAESDASAEMPADSVPPAQSPRLNTAGGMDEFESE